ncbi:MAG: Coq4 family protein [Myxococcota bacterium]
MNLEIPPSPPPQPTQWRRAFRELRALIANPDETDHAIHLIYALGRQEFERNFQRFAASPGGRALLAERPSLLAALSDRESLVRLPENSLGRGYLAYIDRNGFAPDGLLAVQNRVQEAWQRDEGVPALDPLRAWFRDRSLLAHDLFHVLTDYGTDGIGEATLLAFSLAQLGGRGQALLTFGAALEVWRTLGWRWLVYDYRAFRRGRAAAWLVTLPWEELLPLRVETVRRLAGVAEASEVHPGGVLRDSPDARGVLTAA